MFDHKFVKKNKIINLWLKSPPGNRHSIGLITNIWRRFGFVHCVFTFGNVTRCCRLIETSHAMWTLYIVGIGANGRWWQVSYAAALFFHLSGHFGVAHGRYELFVLLTPVTISRLFGFQ